MPRRVIEDTAQYRLYEVTDGGGMVVGQDREPKLSVDEVNAQTLRDRAAQALAANATFLALVSPTNAQVLAQVQRLTKECSALIRLGQNLLDTTDGT